MHRAREGDRAVVVGGVHLLQVALPAIVGHREGRVDRQHAGRGGQRGQDLLGHLETGAAGHPVVHDDDVGLHRSPRGQRLATCISQLCILFFCLVLLWAGISVVETALARNYRSASMLRFPLWIAYGMIPLGGTLLGLATLRQLFIPNSVESNDSIKEF